MSNKVKNVLSYIFSKSIFHYYIFLQCIGYIILNWHFIENKYKSNEFLIILILASLPVILNTDNKPIYILSVLLLSVLLKLTISVEVHNINSISIDYIKFDILKIKYQFQQLEVFSYILIANIVKKLFKKIPLK